MKLGLTGAPDGEEARALFLVWEELGPLLDYVLEGGEWQAVVAMRDLLRELYADKPPRGDLHEGEVACAYRAHCCKEACQSNYLLYLEEDVTKAVANARRLAVCWVPCARMSLRASTPSLSVHTMTTRAGGLAGGSFTSVGVVVFKI